jgi:hypothetical protein
MCTHAHSHIPARVRNSGVRGKHYTSFYPQLCQCTETLICDTPAGPLYGSISLCTNYSHMIITVASEPFMLSIHTISEQVTLSCPTQHVLIRCPRNFVSQSPSQSPVSPPSPPIVLPILCPVPFHPASVCHIWSIYGIPDIL